MTPVFSRMPGFLRNHPRPQDWFSFSIFRFKDGSFRSVFVTVCGLMFGLLK